MSSAAVLEALRGEYETAWITDVKVQDDGSGKVRVDVYTPFGSSQSKKVMGMIRGMPVVACAVVGQMYPKVFVEAYVWPKSRDYYMAGASGEMTNGKSKGITILKSNRPK